MLIGKRIGGRYKILKLIGGGGMSNVYLAHDAILDRDVAIKILRYNFSDEDELHRRFQREASSSTSLTHPNIVSIYDVGEEDDMYYLVMEYIKGQTLKQYIQQYAPLSPQRAVKIMVQLTSAIANAHQNQIIHRDIKPQNILMDEDGNVKISDFGIAMALSATSFTKTNSVLGTVHYLSPEQARGGIATVKSDMYALGIVLYELLTGQLPFSGESAVSIALKHLQSETPSVRQIVPSIPQSLENVVLKATAKDPRYRYDSVEAMREDLETVLDDARAHDAKFIVPEDIEKTKAIPVIRDFVPAPPDEEVTRVMAVEKTPEPKPVETPKKKKRNKWLVTLGILAVFMLLFLATLVLFPQLFKPKQVTVPDVSDIALEKALDDIQEAGLSIGKRTMQYSDTIASGNVIVTMPGAGKKVDQHTEVDLVVSEGKEEVTMNDYVGRDINQVKKLLTKQGFDVKIKKQFSEQPVDQILTQSPKSGKTVVPNETTVTLTISKGIETFTLANLLGYSTQQLQDYAAETGFNIRITDEKYSDTIEKGHVLSQNPPTGTKLSKGNDVTVVVSKGVEEKATKTLIRTIEIPYDDTNEALADEEAPETEIEAPTRTPQKINIYIQDKDHQVTDVYQTFTITETTTKRLKLVIEEGSEGIYRITRDDETIYDETILYDDL